MRVLTFDGWDVFRKAVWVSFLSFGTYTEGGDQGCVCVCVQKGVRLSVRMWEEGKME